MAHETIYSHIVIEFYCHIQMLRIISTILPETFANRIDSYQADHTGRSLYEGKDYLRSSLFSRVPLVK